MENVKNITKKELIKMLKGLTDKKPKELEKMKKAELAALLDELNQNSEDTPDTPDDPNSAEKEGTESENKDEDTPKEEWKEAEFFSFCGFPFDSNESSECWTMCKEDSPEEFKKCLENFRTAPAPTPKKTTRKKTAGQGVNRFGRRVGSQAALIEKALDEEEPMTIKALANYAGCKVSRVRRHFRRLIHTEEKAKVLIAPDKTIFFLSRFPDKEGKSAYPVYKGHVDDVNEIRNEA